VQSGEARGGGGQHRPCHDRIARRLGTALQRPMTRCVPHRWLHAGFARSQMEKEKNPSGTPDAQVHLVDEQHSLCRKGKELSQMLLWAPHDVSPYERPSSAFCVFSGHWTAGRTPWRTPILTLGAPPSTPSKMTIGMSWDEPGMIGDEPGMIEDELG